MTDKTGGSAFPLPQGSETTTGCDGMTLRDYFAAKAMQGDFAAQSNEIGIYGHHLTYEQLDNIAKFHYSMADAMLRAREK